MNTWAVIVSIGWFCFIAGAVSAEIGQPPHMTEPITVLTVVQTIITLMATYLMGIWSVKPDDKAAARARDRRMEGR